MELVSQVRRGYIVNASETKVRKGILKLLEVNGDNNQYGTGYNLGAFWNLLMQQMDKLNVYSDICNLIVHQEEADQAFLSDFSFFETVLELTIIVNRIAKQQMILSILVYTLFSRMFDLMQPPAVKHSIAVV